MLGMMGIGVAPGPTQYYPAPFKIGAGFFIKIMSNVFHLKDYKKEFDTVAYRQQLSSMHKIDLLDEMVKFNEELQEKGYTPQLCKRGIILFEEILMVCETPEMKKLSQQMLKYLGQK